MERTLESRKICQASCSIGNRSLTYKKLTISTQMRQVTRREARRKTQHSTEQPLVLRPRFAVRTFVVPIT